MGGTWLDWEWITTVTVVLMAIVLAYVGLVPTLLRRGTYVLPPLTTLLPCLCTLISLIILEYLHTIITITYRGRVILL